MAELKIKKTKDSVADFIAAIKDPIMRTDAATLVGMMEKATGEKARMWGSIVGVRDVHLRYATGREIDWFAIGFAPRKGGLSVYLGCGAVDPDARAMLAQLGPHKMGAGCLSIKRLDDIDLDVLGSMIKVAAKATIAAETPKKKGKDPRTPARRKTAR
jgi:hypothetical protein